jgi:protein TonB
MSEVHGLRPSPMGFSLPVLGEDHPLRRRFRRTFAVSATVAILIHVAAAAGRLVAINLMKEEAISERPVQFISVENITPPSVTEEEPPPVASFAENVATPTIGIPDPVPDYEATELTLATEEEMSEAMSTSLDALLGGGDSLVVSFDAGLPSADEYVVVEVQPVAISTPSPEYPAIARQAGVEGIVTLRVLVDDDGDVRDVVFVSGPEMLKDAAIAGVRLWKFRPALQQQHPVAVWVMVPMKFSLTR